MSTNICRQCNEPFDRCACEDNPLNLDLMVPLRLVEEARSALDVPMEPSTRSATIREIAEHQKRVIDSCCTTLDFAISEAKKVAK